MLAACTPGLPADAPSSDAYRNPNVSERHTSAEPESLAELLRAIAIAPEHQAGYKRGLFPHWTDADGDGCDTRDEVLLRQAVKQPAIRGNCALTGGQWFSEYDGRTIGDPTEVDVDHVVALGEAWRSGAYLWTKAEREDYANDLEVPWGLIAVSAGMNESKSDADPADWVPPRAAELCPYLAAWIGVKVRWGLTMDEREHQAIATLIDHCRQTRLEVPRHDGNQPY